MQATQTANGKYGYNTVFQNKTLNDWVQEFHKINCEENKWSFTPLKPGAYGYDNLVICLGNFFSSQSAPKETSLEEVAILIHDSWVENYIYWRDNKPWEKEGYFKPFKPINDERRNKCAETSYKDLPDDEKEKDLILARYIIKLFAGELPE